MPALRDLLFVPGREDDTALARGVATRAVVALAGIGLGLSLAVAFTLPVLAAPDERAHLAYVEALLAGELPTVDGDIRVDGWFVVLDEYYRKGPEASGPRGDVWVANHPPLAYLGAIPLTWAAAAVGYDKGPPLAMRVLSAGGMFVGVLATAAVGDALLPGRRRTVAVAAGLAAVTPALVSIGGYGYTDGLSFAVGTALLAAILRVARHGPTRRRGLALVALGAAAMLTRSALVPLVPLAALVWFVRTWRTGAARSIVTTVAVVALPTLAGAWFYVRNHDLYGNATAGGYLQEKFGRTPSESVPALFVPPRFLASAAQNLWGAFSDFGDHVAIGSGAASVGSPDGALGSRLVVGATLVGTATIGWVWSLARRERERASLRLPWAVGIGWLAITIVGLASFVSGGGSTHPRYLLPALSVIAVLIAGGIARLPRGLRLVEGAIAALVAIDLVLVVRTTRFVRDTPFTDLFVLPSWADAVVVLALVGAGGAAVVATRSLRALSEP